MSRDRTTYQPFQKKSLVFWFAISVGAVACFYLYKNPNIPVSRLIPLVLVFGAIMTAIVELLKIAFDRIVRMYKRKKKRERRQERARGKLRRNTASRVSTKGYRSKT